MKNPQWFIEFLRKKVFMQTEVHHDRISLIWVFVCWQVYSAGMLPLLISTVKKDTPFDYVSASPQKNI
jgi:hypothetical protein